MNLGVRAQGDRAAAAAPARCGWRLGMTSPLTRGAGASAARAWAGRWGPPGSGKARAQGQVELGRGAGLACCCDAGPAVAKG